MADNQKTEKPSESSAGGGQTTSASDTHDFVPASRQQQEQGLEQQKQQQPQPSKLVTTGGDGGSISSSGGGAHGQPEAPRKSSVSSAASSTNTSLKTPLKSPADAFGATSPEGSDIVYQYPIRSAISIDPNKTSADFPSQTPAVRIDRGDGYFPPQQRYGDSRRMSSATGASAGTPNRARKSSADMASSASEDDVKSPDSASALAPKGHRTGLGRYNAPRLPPQVFSDIVASRPADFPGSEGVTPGELAPSLSARSYVAGSVRSKGSTDDMGGLMTTRFEHVLHEGGHHVITGRGGEQLQRCEDEPIQCPGAVQGYGLIIVLREEEEGKFRVRIVSENSARMMGYSPRQLFALDNFCDILTEEQSDNLLDHIDFVRDEDADLETNGPEVFMLTIRPPGGRSKKFWCALHVSDELNPGLIVCEFELEDDPVNPLAPPNESTPELPEDTLGSNPTEEEYLESTENISRPLRVLRSARKRKGETAAMEVFNIMSQVQEQLAVAPNLEKFLKVLVGVVKELTGFHRVMIYQFDKMFNGRVVTELVDPRATKDLYKGLNFPSSDIPSQARQLYKINKVRLLYDRDQETARLVCRTLEDLECPLDLTHSYLRAMSPIHLKYLANMAVRSSMSISINAFNELWGLIACHSYGQKGMRVSFPIRKMCRLVGDAASRNIERLSYASRLQARKLISTQPTQANPSGYIIASSEDLLRLFDADFGLLSIREETKILGGIEQSQEALALLEYLRMRKFTSVLTSQDIIQDFPDLRYTPGFATIAGMLVVPLSAGGQDFIVFFRKGQLKEVKWAGNPYEKFIREGTEGYLEPRKSFRTWSEMVVGRCKEWSEEEIETAAVLCLVYGKFIEVWRQKEAALQSSQLTRLLLANSAHEVRTPLNAIINYLEIALEGTLDQETRDNLAKSHSASKSLIYVINDLLDLTNTEEGADLVKGEVFDIGATLKEATDLFTGDAQRKNITYEVVELPGVPQKVVGDQRRVRQAISNITANAIQNTTKGGVKVEMYVASWEDTRCNIEIAISDTGAGMSARKLDALFRELEQVQTEESSMIERTLLQDTPVEQSDPSGKKTLGLGLAVVARIIRNMQGQLRLKSEENQGSRFVIQFPFELPETETKNKTKNKLSDESTAQGSTTPRLDVDEKTLVYPASNISRRPSQELERRNSGDSTKSLKSLGSFKSGQSAGSVRSGRSDVDRLIEDIQKPTLIDSPRSAGELKLRRPSIGKRHSSYTGATSPRKPRSKSLEGQSESHARVPLKQQAQTPGQETVAYSGFPIKPVKIPDDENTAPAEDTSTKSGIIGEIRDEPGTSQSQPPLSAEHMRVLVAEDDPVNSRIIKKRMEKLGHDVKLTVNGEECSGVYQEAYLPDCILMDIQMPIVDGIASTKMIRSYEKTNPSHKLSARAALNGRVPIIAVSASLLEKERQNYMDIGFDGWILKPISFPRISELMKGIVDPKTREEALYQPGQWEKGGWFHRAQPDVVGAKSTLLSSQAPAGEGAEQIDKAPVPTGDTDGRPDREGEGPNAGADGKQGERSSEKHASDNQSNQPTLGRTTSEESSQVFQTPLSTPMLESSEPATQVDAPHPT